MEKKRASGGQTINLLFTMLLFLVFVLCALFTVLIGGRVYENISARMEENYTGSVAVNYIANKIRQGDQAGALNVVEFDGTPAVELKQEIEDRKYVTWIYYYEGSIRELYTREDSGLGLADGLEIMECEGLSLSKEGRLITIRTTGEGGGALTLAVRSGGPGNE